ncbi:MAG: hypothetical protein ACFFD4_07895 [Candidatus Odinarchaeota archaeon]
MILKKYDIYSENKHGVRVYLLKRDYGVALYRGERASDRVGGYRTAIDALKDARELKPGDDYHQFVG